jgi:hypothetical protein
LPFDTPAGTFTASPEYGLVRVAGGVTSVPWKKIRSLPTVPLMSGRGEGEQENQRERREPSLHGALPHWHPRRRF